MRKSFGALDRPIQFNITMTRFRKTKDLKTSPDPVAAAAFNYWLLQRLPTGCCSVYLLTAAAFNCWLLQRLHTGCCSVYLLTAAAFTYWLLQRLPTGCCSVYLLAAAAFTYWLATSETFLRTAEADQATTNPGVEVKKRIAC